jgi:hypothetical protein
MEFCPDTSIESWTKVWLARLATQFAEGEHAIRDCSDRTFGLVIQPHNAERAIWSRVNFFELANLSWPPDEFSERDSPAFDSKTDGVRSITMV